MRLLVYVVPVALAIYALFDLQRAEPSERAGLRPLLWVLVIVLLPVIGPIVWLFVSTTRRAEARGAGPQAPTPTPTPGGFTSGWPTRPTQRPGPTAPDDDPEFLRRLDQQRRRNRHERGGDATPPDTNPPTA